MLDIAEMIIQDDRQIHQVTAVETVGELVPGCIVLDIRPKGEQEDHPLVLDNVPVQALPFYNLANQFGDLDQSKSYLLYCERGVMSRLQVLYLREQGFRNVKIYRP